MCQGVDGEIQGLGRREYALALSVAVLVGTAAWTVAGAYRENLLGFTAVMAVGSVGYGLICPDTARVFGLSVAAMPIVLSLFTAHQGDGDGLWLLIVPMLAGLGALLAWVTRTVADRVSGKIPRRTSLDRAVRRAAMPVTALSLVSTVWLVVWMVESYPDPWPELRAVLATYELPDSFEVHDTRQFGSPLQVRGGAPRLERRHSASGSPRSVCQFVPALTDDWVDDGTLDLEDDLSGPPSASGFLCRASGTVTLNGETTRVGVLGVGWRTGRLGPDHPRGRGQRLLGVAVREARSRLQAALGERQLRFHRAAARPSRGPEAITPADSRRVRTYCRLSGGSSNGDLGFASALP